MKRFFGMMPMSEIELTKYFATCNDGAKVIVEAGKNGWTITYEDHSTEFKDGEAHPAHNLGEAIQVLKSKMAVVEIQKDGRYDLIKLPRQIQHPGVI